LLWRIKSAWSAGTAELNKRSPMPKLREMKNKLGRILTAELQNDILKRWLHSEDNSIKVIAAEFDCSKQQIHRIIDHYILQKSFGK
jgi:predicted DNA-binding protein YlxM (UPF0122 family)